MQTRMRRASASGGVPASRESTRSQEILERDKATLEEVAQQASFEKKRVGGRMGNLSRSLTHSVFGSTDDVTRGEDATLVDDTGTLTPADLRMIIKLQNRWRAVRLSAYHFAPTYFRRHGGLPAVHGQLSFQRSVSYFVATSPYMVLVAFFSL